MKQSNIDRIKKIEGVIDVEEFPFDKKIEKELEDKLPSKLFDIARENSKTVNIYKVTYKIEEYIAVGFISEPKDTDGQKYPCIIYNCGGSQRFVALTPSVLFTEVAKFTNWGYVVIATEYAGSKESKNMREEIANEFGGDGVKDALCLFGLLKKYPIVDTARSGVYGYTAGGTPTYFEFGSE